MTDALCGPSNPLQSFQKHASVDRTLQRDRILSRQSPSQGFRTPKPNSGLLEAEYEAFIAGEPTLEPMELRHTWQNHRSPALNSENFHQQTPDWALDFQNLHVDEPRTTPISSTQFRQQAPMQRSSSGSWQHEFMQKHQPQGYQHQQSRLGYVNTGHLMNAGHSGTYNHLYSTPTVVQHSESQMKESFDEEAFEKAFNQADLEVHGVSDTTTTFNPSTPSEAKSVPEDRTGYRIGSDKILDESLERREERSDAKEADELAKTAGLLLENVKHDQSTKFQESSFLSLMRQLRDKEAKVEGDNIISVEQPLHPGGLGYPNGLPANEEVERPRPIGSQTRASSVPHQRRNGSLVQPQPTASSPWLYDPSDHPDGLDLDLFLDNRPDAPWPELSAPVSH